MDLETARRVARLIAEAGKNEAKLLARLLDLGLSEEEAERSIAMVGSAFSRGFLFTLGMKPEQITSDFDDDPVFLEALKLAQAKFPKSELPPPPPLAELIPAVQDVDPERRRRAIFQLGRLRDEGAVQVLLGSLSDPDRDCRIYAIQALKAQKARAALPALLAILASESDPLLLSNTIKALVDLGDRSAVEPLMRATRHEQGMVRFDAAWALGELRDPKAIPALKLLLDDRSQPETWEEGKLFSAAGFPICEQAARALKKLGV